MTDLEAALNGAAVALKNSAREHKRASSAHRKQARESMKALAELKTVAGAMGIELIIIGEGKENHGRK